MNVKVLSSAIAVAMLAGTGSVFAYDTTTTPDVTMNVVGSSGQDKGIKANFESLCDAGTLDTYSGGKDYSAYFCELSSTNVPGLTASTRKVLFVKRSAGGSGVGVMPVATGASVANLNIFNGNCTEDSPGSRTWTCTTSNPGDMHDIVPDAGVSDVDPAMFVGVNTPAGFSDATPDAIGSLTVVPGSALVFNTPVTLTLRNALQHVQFTGTSCDPDEASYTTATGESEACMPSLSSNQIATLMGGKMKKWSELKVHFDNGDGTFTDTDLITAATTLQAGQTANVVAPTKSFVYVCRRTQGSGTQATTNAKFLNVPCSTGALNPLDAAHSSTLFGPIAIEGAGSGDVETCFDDINNGTNVTGGNPSNGKSWAIGLQSTEKNVNNAHGYRYIKVDGYAPTIANAASGKYRDWSESTFQWPSSLTGDKAAIINTIATNAGKMTIVRDILNPGFVYTWGQGGYLALYTNGNTVVTPFSDSNPVTPYSHTSGGSLNNCSIPTIQGGNSDL